MPCMWSELELGHGACTWASTAHVFTSNAAMFLLQMATAPQVIEYFMTLFCNTARIILLMDKVPWRLLVQVCSAMVQQHDPPAC